MFGWGMTDEMALPAQLQNQLQRDHPQLRVIVRDFSSPSFTSAQELSTFVAMLRKQPKPDAAVFLDGLNDLSHWWHLNTDAPLFGEVNLAWEAWVRRLTDRTRPWFSINATFPPFRLFSKAARGSMDGSSLRTPSTTAAEEERIERATAAYLFNTAVAEQAARVAGVDALFFLQPLPRDRKKRHYQRFYEAALERSEVRSLKDLSDALADLPRDAPKTVETTGAHYSDIANRHLAETLSAILSDKMLSSLASR